jgi:hypothetical protein
MSTKALYDKLFETFEEETSNKIEALTCKEIDHVINNKKSLTCGYIEHYSDYSKGVFEMYEKMFYIVNKASPIPETLKYFEAYWKSTSEAPQNSYSIPNI